MLYPKLVNKIEYFKEFKDYHDHQYKITKGETLIWIEFGIFMTSYFLLFVSFYRTMLTNPGEVSECEIWKINCPEELNDEQRTNYLTMLFERREEILQANRNIITKNYLECSNMTDRNFNKFK